MFCYQMVRDSTLRSARLGATTLPDSSDVVLEAVARPVRESRRVLGQTREGLEKGDEKELEAIVVGEKEKEWRGCRLFRGRTWWDG